MTQRTLFVLGICICSILAAPQDYAQMMSSIMNGIDASAFTSGNSQQINDAYRLMLGNMGVDPSMFNGVDISAFMTNDADKQSAEIMKIMQNQNVNLDPATKAQIEASVKNSVDLQSGMAKMTEDGTYTTEKALALTLDKSFKPVLKFETAALVNLLTTEGITQATVQTFLQAANPNLPAATISGYSQAAIQIASSLKMSESAWAGSTMDYDSMIKDLLSSRISLFSGIDMNVFREANDDAALTRVWNQMYTNLGISPDTIPTESKVESLKRSKAMAAEVKKMLADGTYSKDKEILVFLKTHILPDHKYDEAFFQNFLSSDQDIRQVHEHLKAQNTVKAKNPGDNMGLAMAAKSLVDFRTYLKTSNTGSSDDSPMGGSASTTSASMPRSTQNLSIIVIAISALLCL